MTPLITAGLAILDRVLPNQEARNEAKLELLRMEQDGELRRFEAIASVDKAQAAVNEQEAQSLSLFRAGWRPSVGWVCSLALGYNFLVRPVLAWLSVGWLGIEVPPALDLSELLPLLMGMLGLGAYRTYEKAHNCARST